YLQVVTTSHPGGKEVGNNHENDSKKQNIHKKTPQIDRPDVRGDLSSGQSIRREWIVADPDSRRRHQIALLRAAPKGLVRRDRQKSQALEWLQGMPTDRGGNSRLVWRRR